MATPASLFNASLGRPGDVSALDKIDRSSDDWETRKVTAVGVTTVAHQQISVGKQRAGRIVDVHVGPDLLHIWDGNDLLKTALRHGNKEVRKKKAAAS